MSNDSPRSKRRGCLWALPLLALLLAPFSPVLWSFWKCPSMDRFAKHNPKTTAFMEYRADEARQAGRPYKIRYRPVGLKTIAPPLRRAVVLAEDARFFKHDGFDYDAMRDAWQANQKRGRVVRGGSTISQQVAKNIWLTPERTYWRKAVEAALTWRMERTLSKERILELYLNVIEWGPGVFGVAAAAENYFKAKPAELTPQQAALLAAAIPSPLHFDPTQPSARIRRSQSRILAGLGAREEPTKSINFLDEPPDSLFGPEGAPPPNAAPVPTAPPFPAVLPTAPPPVAPPAAASPEPVGGPAPATPRGGTAPATPARAGGP